MTSQYIFLDVIPFYSLVMCPSFPFSLAVLKHVQRYYRQDPSGTTARGSGTTARTPAVLPPGVAVLPLGIAVLPPGSQSTTT